MRGVLSEPGRVLTDQMMGMLPGEIRYRLTRVESGPGWDGSARVATPPQGRRGVRDQCSGHRARQADITVNCLAPGLTGTPLLRSEPPEVLERLLQAQPMGTIGSPADVAHAAPWSARPRGRSQALYVCGGKSSRTPIGGILSHDVHCAASVTDSTAARTAPSTSA